MSTQVAAAESRYMTKREVAAYLRRSPRTIDRMDYLKRIKAGGIVLFDRASVDAAMKALEV